MPQRWRLLHSPPASGAANMALDEALMAHAIRADEWVLRVYSWNSPTLSLGRNQTASGAYDRTALLERRIDVVRRPTGGRAILHDREITYSVVGPVKEAGALQESYARINRLLIAALQALGISASVVPDGSPSRGKSNTDVDRPGLLPCFHHPSTGEITFAGRKLVGSAQWRCGEALLQHGSILIHDDQTLLSSLLAVQEVAIPHAATLSDALHRVPSESEVTNALFAAVRTVEDANAIPMILDDELLDRAKCLRQRYLDDSWTWRR